MERRHGKPVDPRRFKQRDLADLRGGVEANRRRAASFERAESVAVDRCPVCETPERSHLRTTFGYDYVRCVDCTHVYITERPTEAALAEYLATNEEVSELYTDDRQREYRREQITEPKFDFVREHVGPPGRWLDVGCGVGDSIDHLRSCGWDAVGLEPSEACARVAREEFGVDLVERSLAEYADGDPDREGSFDVVSLFGVLVMNPDPVAELRRARRLLGDDGFVAVGDGRADSLSSLVHRAFPDEALRHSIPPVGLHQFTDGSLDRALGAAGFEPVAVWDFGLDFYEFLTHLRLELDGFADTDLHDYLMDNLDEFQQVVDDDERSDYVLVVARRS
jgi:SAM-dependent methyltransferase